MTTSLSPSAKLVRVAQLLRGGRTHAEVADELELTEDQVREFARDIPGLTAPRPMPPTAAPTTPAAPVRPSPQSVRPAPPAPAPAHVNAPSAAPSPLGRLLEDASGHSVARVRNLAAKIETQLDQLRRLLFEHEEAEAARQAEKAAKEKARAEVARLEQQLAAAKAKLRTPKQPTRPTEAASGDLSCTCGKTYSYAKNLAKHRETCSETT